jgi:hypothetical protein
MEGCGSVPNMVARITMRRGCRRWAVAISAAIGVAAAGCGGTGAAPVTADNVASVYAAAFCDSLARCCQMQGLTYSEETCVFAVSRVPLEGRNFRATNTSFNADIATECVKAARAYDCSDPAAIVALCMLSFSGDVDLGGACDIDADCRQAPEAHAKCNSGACVAANLVGRQGAPCTAVSTLEFECAFYEGFYCSVAAGAAAGTCEPVHDVGAACAASRECRSRTYCDAAASTCAPVRSPNETCDGQLGQCDWRASCDGTTCQPMPRLSAGCS